MKKYLIGAVLALGMAGSAQAQGTISLAPLIGPNGALPIAGLLLGGPNSGSLLAGLNTIGANGGLPLVGPLVGGLLDSGGPLGGLLGLGATGGLLGNNGLVGNLLNIGLGAKALPGGQQLPLASTLFTALPAISNLLTANGSIPIVGTLLGTTGSIPVLGDVLVAIPVVGGILGGGALVLPSSGQRLSLAELPLPLNDLDNATLTGLLGGATLRGL